MFLVLSEVRRTKRKSFEMNLSVAQRSGPYLEKTTPLPYVPAADDDKKIY